jgi:O-antigen ligase
LEAIQAQTARLLRWLFVFMLLFILIPTGSVGYLPLHLTATIFFFIAAVTVLVLPAPRPARIACLLALTIAALLAVWMIVQAMNLQDNPFANPIWSDAERVFGAERKSISVAPGDTLQGLIAVLLPFAIFVTSIFLFQGDRHCLQLVQAIIIPGMVLALIGLVQFQFFPDMLLFQRKYFYLKSLTVVFVNSNSAATYLAMLLVFSAGLAFHHIQNAGFRQLLRFLIGAPNATKPADARAGLLYAFGAGIVFVALMLTKSRAGVASGVLGVIIMSVILAYFGSQHTAKRVVGSFARKRTPTTTKVLRAALVVVAILVIGAAFSGQVIMRAQVQGSNDVRFCFMPGILQMVRDNWLTGTGFGSFAYVFPAYRDPSCGLEGVLTRAHDFYLEGWITLGLPFVILCSAVILGLFYYFIKGVRERRQYRWIPAAGLGVLVIQILHNSIDFSIQIPAVAAVFAALMGAGVVASSGRPARSSGAPAITARQTPSAEAGARGL